MSQLQHAQHQSIAQPGQAENAFRAAHTEDSRPYGPGIEAKQQENAECWKEPSRGHGTITEDQVGSILVSRTSSCDRNVFWSIYGKLSLRFGINLASALVDSRIAKARGKAFRLVEIFQCGMQGLRAGERGIEGLVALSWVVEMDAKGIVPLVNVHLAYFRESRSRFLPRPFGVISQGAESQIVNAESERDESEGWK
jgi:hypothetical protein